MPRTRVRWEAIASRYGAPALCALVLNPAALGQSPSARSVEAQRLALQIEIYPRCDAADPAAALEADVIKTAAATQIAVDALSIALKEQVRCAQFKTAAATLLARYQAKLSAAQPAAPVPAAPGTSAPSAPSPPAASEATAASPAAAAAGAVKAASPAVARDFDFHLGRSPKNSRRGW